MKRRSLLGALLGLPAGAALGAVVPEQVDAAAMNDEARIQMITKIAGSSVRTFTVSGTWTPVEPPTRINDLYLAVDDAGTYRWMRQRPSA